MKLVLQCAMCGTHHPVGTIVCSTCRASGLAQLRLMFECQTCGRLDLTPVCATCPPPAVSLDLDDGLIEAEVIDEPLALDVDDEKLVVDLSEDEAEEPDVFVEESDPDLSEFDSEFDLDLDDVFDDESETEFDEFDDDEDEEEDEDEF